MNPPANEPDAATRWRARAQPLVRGFHRYANWLVTISWKRFILLALLLLVFSGIVQNLPPFSWKVTETVTSSPVAKAPKSPVPPAPPTPPKIRIEKSAPAGSGSDAGGISISIDEKGVRITPRPHAGDGAASAASSPAAGASAADDGSIVITLPDKVDREAVREAIAEAKQAIDEAVRAQKEAAADAAEAAQEAADEVAAGGGNPIRRTRTVHWGDFLPELAMLWIVASAIVKATYKGRIQAEVKAAQATETAESESLKRQVVEARMAAMQAQVEPHFLFNTLASIDHLIETDPKRASVMQKNLIALLRASMPTMREAAPNGVRDLGRELAVIRPYLEILKVRMEERLATEIDVPDGLLSAEFPPMMIQSLVENAIKHGLEPKPEGGTLKVKCEIVHGKLAVTVADTGLGFGKAATAGTGVGLANVRERLQLLYGGKASVTVAENQPSGTIVTITVPYKSLGGADT
jgi:predicted  nucleic acid-binding Zn-ribbon protein